MKSSLITIVVIVVLVVALHPVLIALMQAAGIVTNHGVL